tara:strand:+ start:90 stop:392 length:303 start_codon:yes stop_codon:yes gene_type:complete
VVQDWIESERGWGQRPDGWSIHLTIEDVVEFNEQANKRQVEFYEGQGIMGVPDEYESPIEDSIREMELPKEVHDELTYIKETRGEPGRRVQKWQAAEYGL